MDSEQNQGNGQWQQKPDGSWITPDGKKAWQNDDGSWQTEDGWRLGSSGQWEFAGSNPENPETAASGSQEADDQADISAAPVEAPQPLFDESEGSDSDNRANDQQAPSTSDTPSQESEANDMHTDNEEDDTATPVPDRQSSHAISAREARHEASSGEKTDEYSVDKTAVLGAGFAPQVANHAYRQSQNSGAAPDEGISGQQQGYGSGSWGDSQGSYQYQSSYGAGGNYPPAQQGGSNGSYPHDPYASPASYSQAGLGYGSQQNMPAAYPPHATQGYGYDAYHDYDREDRKEKRNTGGIVAIVLLVLLLVAMIGVGVWLYVWGLADDSQDAQHSEVVSDEAGSSAKQNDDGDDIATEDHNDQADKKIDNSRKNKADTHNRKVLYPAPADAHDIRDFIMPSSNIECQIGSKEVGCSIVERQYEAKGMRDCPGKTVFSVHLTRDGAVPDCHVDYRSGGATLEYGETTAFGEHACESQFEGLRCWNVYTGKEFFLRREDWSAN